MDNTEVDTGPLASKEDLPEDPRIGMEIQGRYRIVRKIGEGGMGAVYEGEHLKIKKRVAIKCLHAQFSNYPDILNRFKREAEAASSIGNEHIIDVTDLGQFPDGSMFMVLEYLTGKDLAQQIDEQHQLSVGRTIHILTQLCDALGAAHNKGIIHRDLKPENIFLIHRHKDPDFVKVLDFGISKFLDTNDESSRTRTGAALGTPYYMAPEQAEGRKDIDHRADIWSLGVLLFRALTGMHPFDDVSMPMIFVKICSMPTPSILQFRPDVPPELDTVIRKCLAKEKDQRYASCQALSEALAPFANILNEPVVTNAPSTKAYVVPTPVFGSQANILNDRIAPQAITLLESERFSSPAPITTTNIPAAIQTQTPVPQVTPTKVTPQRFVKPWVVLATASTLGAVIAIAAIAKHNPQERTMHLTAINTPTTIPVSPVSPPVSEHIVPLIPTPTAVTQPTVPAPERTVDVTISVTPANATLRVNHIVRPNPWTVRPLFSTTEEWTIEATAPDYQGQTTTIRLDFPQTVTIALQRGHGMNRIDRGRVTATRTQPNPTANGTPTPNVVTPVQPTAPTPTVQAPNSVPVATPPAPPPVPDPILPNIVPARQGPREVPLK